MPSARGAVPLNVLLRLLLLLLLLLLLPLALARPGVSQAESSWWVPSQGTTWQWQLGTTAVDQSVEAQMYDIDLFENSAEVVSSLHAQGRHVICYLDAGTWENWRSDAGEFPESVLGNVVQGFSNERWLDISNLPAIEPIMKARLEMCKQKGFDGVEADNVEGFELDTGFPLTAAEQLTYDEWLAETAHSLGLSIALKNDRQQAAELEPYFDFALDEECFQAEECGKLEPFVDAGKAVFEVEYNLEPGEFCEQANAAGYMAMKKNAVLDASRTPCWPQAQGDWVGAKGVDGYDLAGWDGSSDVSYLPDATATLTKGDRYVWSAPTTETRVLESPSGSGRVAATYYDQNQIEVQLHFIKEYKGSLHLYALDWDSQGRRETIAADGQTATLSNFTQGAWVTFPIDVAAGETIPITVTRTGGSNAVLSGIFLGDAGAPPAPKVESSPKGTWVKAVGASGYDLAGWNGAGGDLSYMPGASLSLQQGSRWQWTTNSSDSRALQSPDGATRNAGTYYDPNQIRMQLSFTSAYTGNLHLYAVDWESQGRREIISVNGQSAQLSSDFSQGAWVSFPVSVQAGESVSITVTRVAGGSAVLSGIFLGDAGAPPAPAVTSAPQGKWVGSVGSAGYALTGWNGTGGDVSFLPSETLSLTQGSRYEWAANTTDPRALSDSAEHTRNAGTVYDSTQIQMQLSFATAFSGSLHLYAVDWDSQGRRETISVNGQSAELSSDFSQGAWVTFPVNVGAGGTIPITVTRLAGPNAVLSGIFLGEGGTPPGATVSSAPQGNWVGSYGSAGYDLAAWNGTTDLTELPTASLTVEQASRYVWAPSTTDARALQSPDQKTREAATYYDPKEVKLKLSFPAAYSGNLRLYAVDWDGAGRREIISVNGQSVALSSDFSQGVWISLPISVSAGGNVSITVTSLAGGNAVLSGIFLG